MEFYSGGGTSVQLGFTIYVSAAGVMVGCTSSMHLEIGSVFNVMFSGETVILRFVNGIRN